MAQDVGPRVAAGEPRLDGEGQGDADDDDALIAEDLTDEEIITLEQDEDPGDGRDVDDDRPEVFDGE